MTIPSRITEEARGVYVDIADNLDACGCDACIRSAGDIIAQALLAAEQRGREMEREPVAKWMIAHSYATGHGDTTVSLLAELVGQEREEVVQDCFARAHKHHRQAKEYEAQGDEDSQAICLTCAVEAMDIAAAIRSRKEG